MKFLKSSAHDAALALSDRLRTELENGTKVTWLVTGGSGITATVEAMSLLPDELTKNLTVILSDERYGDVGHQDSNMQKLYDAGFIAKQAHVVPVLIGKDLATTVEHYTNALREALNETSFAVAQFGMGADGHVAGILPHSAALNVADMVASYQGPDYMRITMTFGAIERIRAAYLLCYGESKREALEDLRDSDRSLGEQPAQIFKRLAEVYIYNDQIGDKV